MADQLTPVQIHQAEETAASEGFLHRVAVAADQDLNVDTGGLPDETVSSRVRHISNAHPRWDWNPGVWLAKALNAGLNLVQRDHGQHAQAGDLERALKVVATEQTALGLPDVASGVEPARAGGIRSREAPEARPCVNGSDR